MHMAASGEQKQPMNIKSSMIRFDILDHSNQYGSLFIGALHVPGSVSYTGRKAQKRAKKVSACRSGVADA